MSADSKTPVTNAAVRIADYPFSGGLFIPEPATHDNVRDLLIDCRTELVAVNERIAELKMLYQNERDNMAALLEIDRLKTVISEMTINQQMQDSITAAVMERAEKAEAECAGLRVGAERYQWLRKQAHPTSPESFWVARGGYGPVGVSIWRLEPLDAAIDAARSK